MLNTRYRFSFKGTSFFYLENFVIVTSNVSFPSPEATPLEEPSYHQCAQYNGTVPERATVTVYCVRPVFGRFLFVYLPFLDRQLTLCEVEVYTPLRKLSLCCCVVLTHLRL